MTHIRNLRQRANRRLIALLAVFAIALSGTGLASLAVLTDNITATVNGSVTTIDVNVNGTKNASIDLASGAIPGEFRYASLHFTNSGSGYAKLPSGTSIQSGAGQLTADSAIKVWSGVAPESCNASAGFPFTSPQALSAALWDNEPQIDAGASLDVCLQYRLGTTNADYTDGISAFSILYAFNAYYP